MEANTSYNNEEVFLWDIISKEHLDLLSYFYQDILIFTVKLFSKFKEIKIEILGVKTSCSEKEIK